MDSLQVGVGAVLLVISSAVLLATGTVDSSVPILLAAAAALGMAAGSWLIGTSGDERPV